MNLEACCCQSGKKLQIKNQIISKFNLRLEQRSPLKSKFDEFVFYFLFFLQSILTFFALISIGLYRSVFTAHFGAGVCRFEPSCSAYANEAFLKLPFFRALKLTLIRLFKCRPGSSFGFDPLPINKVINI